MSATGSSNPEYVNARVSARRATLFDEEDYRKLLRMSPDEISRYMEESTYQGPINRLGSRFAGVDLIEYALNAGLAETFDELLAWADGRLYEQVARYLRKFDAWNVKTAVRGVYADTDAESIEDDVIRAGELDDDLLDRLVDAESIDAIVDLLEGTLFGEPLAAAYEVYEESGTLVALENAIDRAYYENLFEGVTTAGAGADSAYAEFLQAEIDFRNARNALRLARSGADIDPAEYFIEGGTLFTPEELSALSRNRDQLVERIRESRYGDELTGALDELTEADSLIGFEHALEGALLEHARNAAHAHPMSICPVIAFVLAKEREADNIRAIARGTQAGLDPEEIRAEMVVR
ncbi:V-type ATP synthase subunit C [Halolamina salifodinae]|uniref:A-type ATP synthase subunit C n=1 Tax=Halolamina salifodinae TaxID=1202767 RepID=A0A8T4GWD5_9EURY|nr:V-type ATP synthase subunit C [Halolamina salifodinae]MBP1986383.1 V/A-type H+-transporting ATPase subunit C [Halolamina salifodinae]